MWLILQHDNPEDWVIAIGEMHSVREFVMLAFGRVGFELEWNGEGINETGIDKSTGKVLVKVSPEYFRPTEVEELLGDPSKATQKLGWNPRNTSFKELVEMMVDADMKLVETESK